LNPLLRLFNGGGRVNIDKHSLSSIEFGFLYLADTCLLGWCRVFYCVSLFSGLGLRSLFDSKKAYSVVEIPTSTAPVSAFLDF
jgi:hypothetical protein